MGYICITLLFLALLLPHAGVQHGGMIGIGCAIGWFVLMILAKAGVWVAP
jgi:hypothetical protein